MDDASREALRNWAEIKRAEHDGKIERERMLSRLRDEMRQGTPRFMRATSHARSMLHTVTKFIAEANYEDAYEEFLLAFFWGDFEVVQVPPERDIEMKAKIEAHKFTLPKIIIPLTDEQ